MDIYINILPHTHTHTHTHTQHFISILRTILAAGRVLAACMSRFSLVYFYLRSFHMSSQLLLSRFMTQCCSDVEISWLDGWANQWRPSPNHNQVQCCSRKENRERQVGVMQETKGKSCRNSMSKRIVLNVHRVYL